MKHTSRGSLAHCIHLYTLSVLDIRYAMQVELSMGVELRSFCFTLMVRSNQLQQGEADLTFSKLCQLLILLMLSRVPVN